MNTELVKYEAARRALAEVRRVDEAKNIRDKAKAMQVYAQQAKDRVLIEHATDIRMRAEIRAGELLREMQKNKGAREPGTKRGATRSRGATASVPKLSDIGISKTQSSRWQKLAALPVEKQEAKIAQAKQKAEAAVEPVARSNGVQAKKKQKRERDPVSRCAMKVRRLIWEAMQEMSAQQASELLSEIRADIDDLETKAKGNGHHTTSKSA